MASPSPHLPMSPPRAAPISLPRKRPSISTSGPPAKRRRPSVSAASNSPHHPLRQTSFPPPGGDDESRGGSFSPTVESVTGASSVDAGPKGKGRKGGKKKALDGRSATMKGGRMAGAGRRGKSASVSVVDGGGRRGRAVEEEEDDVDEDEGDGDGAEDTVLEGGKEDEAALKMDREHLAMLVNAFDADQADRYDIWRRVRLKKEVVRKLTNQTLSQSVTAPIITTINGYTKIFIGELIERAREVQTEWLAASLTLPTGELKSPHVEKTIATANDQAEVRDGDLNMDVESGGSVPIEAGSSRLQDEASASIHDASIATDNLFIVEERDRGPLTPDHLREALRRYKKDREGGSAGFQGLSLQGREVVASRAGARRLFR